MDLIYTDTKGKELGVVYTTLDMEIGEEATNDFEIEYKRSEWDGTVENGCFFYVPETEFGGIVREIKTSTKTNTITAKGYTWRGMMMKKIIEPQSGQDYATATGELNEIVGEKVKEAFPGLFYGSDADTGVQVKDYKQEITCALNNVNMGNNGNYYKLVSTFAGKCSKGDKLHITSYKNGGTWTLFATRAIFIPVS